MIRIKIKSSNLREQIYKAGLEIDESRLNEIDYLKSIVNKILLGELSCNSEELENTLKIIEMHIMLLEDEKNYMIKQHQKMLRKRNKLLLFPGRDLYFKKCRMKLFRR